ncbi:hypothetical protein WJ972_18560 [Achromobacter insuavis]
MSALTHPSRTAGAPRVRGVLWLAFLALLLRALVPTGYMPDARALHDGRLEVTFCSAAGDLTTFKIALSPDGKSGGGHSSADTGAQCPSACWPTSPRRPPRRPPRWRSPSPAPPLPARPRGGAGATGPRAAAGARAPRPRRLTPLFRAAPPRLRTVNRRGFHAFPLSRAPAGAAPAPTATGAGCSRPWPCCRWPAAAPTPPSSTAWT